MNMYVYACIAVLYAIFNRMAVAEKTQDQGTWDICCLECICRLKNTTDYEFGTYSAGTQLSSNQNYFNLNNYFKDAGITHS